VTVSLLEALLVALSFSTPREPQASRVPMDESGRAIAQTPNSWSVGRRLTAIGSLSGAMAAVAIGVARGQDSRWTLLAITLSVAAWAFEHRVPGVVVRASAADLELVRGTARPIRVRMEDVVEVRHRPICASLLIRARSGRVSIPTGIDGLSTLALILVEHAPSDALDERTRHWLISARNGMW